nr:DNA polymerase III subunit delta' [Microbacter margulisiae]
MFRDIIGQETTKQRLKNLVHEERIPHALLINGSAGIGKLSLALAFAQYINCKHPTTDDACGTCPSCVKFAKLEHPDLHFVFPIVKLEKSKVAICDDFVSDFRHFLLQNPYGSNNDWMSQIASEKQGMIYEAESNEIVRKLSLKTYESEYKVMAIWQPERMNAVCANKLLKILEEPPAKTLFLLVSEQPDALLTTIQSRTQRINVPLIHNIDLAEAVQSRFNLSEEHARYVARIANGNFRKALEIIELNEEQKFNFEQFVYFMRQSYQRNVFELKSWSEMMAKIGRERQKSFISYVQKMLRENFILNLKQEELNYLNQDEMQFSQKFSPFVNERNIEAMMDQVDLAELHIEGNVQAKMVFLDLSLQFSHLLKK